MHSTNTTEVGASVPANEVAPTPEKVEATQGTTDSTTDFTQAAAFLEVLTRIADALEKQNENLGEICASVNGVNYSIQDAGGCR